VPDQVFVDVVSDVTVISTMHWVPAGVFVIEKLFTLVVELTVVVKKGAGLVPSSFLALTTILTPLVGIVELIVTVKSNGPLDAGCTELIGGLVVTTRLASVGGGGGGGGGVPPPPLLLPHPEDIRAELKKRITINFNTDFIHIIKDDKLVNPRLSSKYICITFKAFFQ